MEDLSLHILDIAENAISAGARNIAIYLEENEAENLLTLQIRDDGRGMDEETRKKALDPFFTTKQAKKVGLGLPLLAQACREAEGSLEIDSKPGKGTTIIAKMKLNHIDRKPIGDIEETLKALIIGNPEVKFKFVYKKDGSVIKINSEELIEKAGGVNNLPGILRMITKKFQTEEKNGN